MMILKWERKRRNGWGPTKSLAAGIESLAIRAQTAPLLLMGSASASTRPPLHRLMLARTVRDYLKHSHE